MLLKKGIREAKLQEQLACFEKGFPYLQLSAAASVAEGILVPTPEEEAHYQQAWNAYTQADGHQVVKFVPASGAASRMFKDMFAFVDADYDVP
ncbi:hypothetical protein EVA_21675, partial [gut metagenome]